jgi:hypothetical protein
MPTDTPQRIDKSRKYTANPRQITGEQFELLKKHLETLGDLSGVVYCTKNKAYLGGNMRSEIMDGCEIEVVERFDQPTPQKTLAHGFITYGGEKFAYREVAFTKREFKQACIVANSSGGSWDWDVLANGEWSDLPLGDWGLDVPSFEPMPDLDGLFIEDTEEKEDKEKIVLHYGLDEIELVKAALLKHGKTYEAAVWALCGL